MGKKGEDKKPKKSGCLKPAFFLIFLLIGALGAGVYFTFEPQDLSDIDGYREEPAAIPPTGRDLAAVLRASQSRLTPATITEEEINDYLSRTLRLDQVGITKGFVTLRGVWVRLESGHAEVILEREINFENFSRRHTVAMHLAFTQTIDPNVGFSTGFNPLGHTDSFIDRMTAPNAGRLGKVPVVEGYLVLVRDSFVELLNAYPEIKTVFEELLGAGMRVGIEEGRLVITPPPAG